MKGTRAFTTSLPKRRRSNVSTRAMHVKKELTCAFMASATYTADQLASKLREEGKQSYLDEACNVCAGNEAWHNVSAEALFVRGPLSARV
jgi:hypothetical protein